MTWLQAITLMVMTAIICLTLLIGWIAYLKYVYEEDPPTPGSHIRWTETREKRS
jgi:hypothetical protein